MDERTRQHKLAAARVVAGEFAGRDDVEAVFLTGSLLAGLGNEHSDVDIYVITAASSDDATLPSIRRRDGVRIDVEIRRPGWMIDLARRASRFEASRQNLGSIQRPPVRLATAVRLMLSEPVKRSAEYDAAIAALISGERDLRRYLMGAQALVNMGITEDCIGALHSGDDHSAALSSAALLANSAQTYLTGAGDLYQGEKWIPARLLRSAGPHAPLADLLGVLTGTVAVDAARLVVLRLRLAQIFSAAGMTLGWDEAQAHQWPVWDIHTDDGLRPTPGCMPLRVNDAIVLEVVPERQFKISERALVVWALCQGGTVAEIAGRAEAALAGTRWQADADTIATIVTKFSEMGVVDTARPRAERAEPVSVAGR